MIELKIEPEDLKNYSTVYVDIDEKSVCIMGSTFAEKDPEKLVVMSLDQFKNMIESFNDLIIKRNQKNDQGNT